MINFFYFYSSLYFLIILKVLEIRQLQFHVIIRRHRNNFVVTRFTTKANRLTLTACVSYAIIKGFPSSESFLSRDRSGFQLFARSTDSGVARGADFHGRAARSGNGKVPLTAAVFLPRYSPCLFENFPNFMQIHDERRVCYVRCGESLES